MRFLSWGLLCGLLCSSAILGAATKQNGMQDTVTAQVGSFGLSSKIYDACVVHLHELLSAAPGLSWTKATTDSIPEEKCKENLGSVLWEIAQQTHSTANAGDSCPAEQGDLTGVTPEWVYIFHITKWIDRSAGTVGAAHPNDKDKGLWEIYRPQDGILKPVPTTGTGDPIIYGAKHALLLNLDIFDSTPQDGSFQSNLSFTVSQGTPQNFADVGALASAFFGLGGGAATQMSELVKPATQKLYSALRCQDGTPQLPFDMQVTGVSQFGSQVKPDNADVQQGRQMAGSIPPPDSGGGNNPMSSGKTQSQGAKTGTLNCTGRGVTTPCTVTRTFTSEDKEFWDFSGGLAIPGVRETSFTFSATTNKTSISKTTHTEAYVFLDLFPFAYVVPKESGRPHISVGVPVTSKSLYRPFFGLSEDLTVWKQLQKKLSLPAEINFVVGACYMKTETITGPLPTTQAEFTSSLGYHRVWKPMFGVEIPVSSITSKIGKGKGSQSGSSKSSGS